MNQCVVFVVGSLLPMSTLRSLTWWMRPGLPRFCALPLPCIILSANRTTKNGGGLGARLYPWLSGSVIDETRISCLCIVDQGYRQSCPGWFVECLETICWGWLVLACVIVSWGIRLTDTPRWRILASRRENGNPNKLCIVDKQYINKQFCQLYPLLI